MWFIITQCIALYVKHRRFKKVTMYDSAAMGFSVRITERETGNNLFPQWCPLRNREQKQKQVMGLVGPRGRWRPKFCGVRRNFFLEMS